MSEGSYMSIDLDTKKLKKYYSNKSPQGAYGVVKIYFESKGFTHLKDTNYENRNITTEETALIITSFADKNKWFASCVNKVNISLLTDKWDLTNDIKNDCRDKEFELMKEKEWNNSIDRKLEIAKKNSVKKTYNKTKSKIIEL